MSAAASLLLLSTALRSEAALILNGDDAGLDHLGVNFAPAARGFAEPAVTEESTWVLVPWKETRFLTFDGCSNQVWEYVTPVRMLALGLC